MVVGVHHLALSFRTNDVEALWDVRDLNGALEVFVDVGVPRSRGEKAAVVTDEQEIGGSTVLHVFEHAGPDFSPQSVVATAHQKSGGIGDDEVVALIFAFAHAAYVAFEVLLGGVFEVSKIDAVEGGILFAPLEVIGIGVDVGDLCSCQPTCHAKSTGVGEEVQDLPVAGSLLNPLAS